MSDAQLPADIMDIESIVTTTQPIDLPHDIMSQPQSQPPPNMPTQTIQIKPNLFLTHTRPILKFTRNMVESLGFAFGPLAISPLFTFNAIIASEPSEQEILSALSLCIYTIIFIATIKYIIILLSIRNDKEGGLFSLAALVLDSEEELFQTSQRAWLKKFCMLLAILGASFLLGDIAMTPPIALLAAMDGLEAFDYYFKGAVVPLTSVMLVILFILQRLGISKVRLVYGIIMSLWSISILAIGIHNITLNPKCLQAFNPAYLFYFFQEGDLKGFHMFGSAVLVLTGIDAVHKEIGRFGAGPIRFGWILIIFPSLILSYLGQGAALMIAPSNYINPFYLAIPYGLFWPMLILAIICTMIASSGVIQSAFALVSQAIALDFFPNITIEHTSRTNKSEVFIPMLNIVMLFITIVLVITFKTSFALSDAYGMSICFSMIITTILFIVVIWVHWKRLIFKLLFIFPFVIFYLPYQLLFLAGNSAKFPTGAWLPLLLGLSCAVVMGVWTYGYHALCRMNNADIAMSYDEFDNKHMHMQRSKGIGIFLVSNTGGVPKYVIKYADAVNTLPEIIIFISIKFFKIPYVNESKRMTTVFINENMIRVTARYGFLEKNVLLPDIVERVIKKYDLNKYVIEQQQSPIRSPSSESIMSQELDRKDKKEDTDMDKRSEKSWDDWIIDLVDVDEVSTNVSVYYFLPQDYVKVDRGSVFWRRWLIVLFMFLRGGVKNETRRLQIPSEHVFEIGNMIWL